MSVKVPHCCSCGRTDDTGEDLITDDEGKTWCGNCFRKSGKEIKLPRNLDETEEFLSRKYPLLFRR